MNNEQKQVIRKEIEEHVAQISSYKETAKRDSDMSGIKRLLQCQKGRGILAHIKIFLS